MAIATSLSIDRLQRDIDALACFTSTPEAGVTRLPFTTEQAGAMQWLVKQMREAGLSVTTDAAGNVAGRLAGRQGDAPAVLIGSHYDTVPHGGKLDGNLGILAGLEVLRAMQAEGLTPHYPIDLYAFNDEEGVRFGSGFFGSKALTGQLGDGDLERFRDARGISIAQAMRAQGFDTEELLGMARHRASVKAFLELHIEQGPVLAQTGKCIGIVESIVGMRRYQVALQGRPDHAGTTPMNVRADALVGAVQVIAQLKPWAQELGHGMVATVGQLELLPGAVNIVPSLVRFSLDLRCVDGELLEIMVTRISSALDAACKTEGLSWSWEQRLATPPVLMDPDLRTIIQQEADCLGLPSMTMPSGAGHDAAVLATIAPTAMIFVPSVGGRSHCPEEGTERAHLEQGLHLLYRTVCRVAKAGD